MYIHMQLAFKELLGVHSRFGSFALRFKAHQWDDSFQGLHVSTHPLFICSYHNEYETDIL